MFLLERSVRELIHRQQLIPPGPLVVALSAGPDSMALFHVLIALAEDLRCQPTAVYVDHGLRPEETIREQECVRAVSGAAGVPSRIVSVDVSSHARQKKMSLEHAARELRYQVLRNVAAEIGASRIATGHTADDQIEGFLFRLLRGSSRRSLAGMRAHSDDLVRPLLGIHRAQIVAYLREKKAVYCHDSSNSDLRFTRNRIRHRLLPFLRREFDPAVDRAILKTAAILSEEEDFLEEKTWQAFQEVVSCSGKDEETACLIDRKTFQALHPCLQRRVAEKVLWHVGGPARYQHIMMLMHACREGVCGKELHLSRGLRVLIHRDTLKVFAPRGRVPWRGTLRGRK